MEEERLVLLKEHKDRVTLLDEIKKEKNDLAQQNESLTKQND